MTIQFDGSQDHAAQEASASTGRLRVVRVNCAGMADRDNRLVDIVFRHGAGQRFKFVRHEPSAGQPGDIVLANPFHPDGVRALAQARSGAQVLPTVNVVPAGSAVRTNYTVQQERLGLELLPCLNRLMEQAFESASPGVGLLDSDQLPSPEETASQDQTVSVEVPADAPEAVDEPQPVLARATAVTHHNDTLLIGLKQELASRIEQTIALSGQLLVGCSVLTDPSQALSEIKSQESKFVVLSRHLKGTSAFVLARQIRREYPDVVVLVICERQVLLDHVLAFFAGRVCLLSSRFGVNELTSAIGKPLRQARERRRGSRQFDWGSAHSPWLNTGTGQ